MVAHTAQEITNSKPVIVTYHDLGLNYVSNFQAFFNYPDFKEIASGFPIFHINAPGQEVGAVSLAGDYEYPSMEQLAEQVQEVLNHFKIVKYIGIGVGMGANILTRHGLAYPERVDCMMLINTWTSKAGWVEWGYQKRNINHMRTQGITQTVLDYLLWHHLGDDHDIRAHDLLQVCKSAKKVSLLVNYPFIPPPLLFHFKFHSQYIHDCIRCTKTISTASMLQILLLWWNNTSGDLTFLSPET